MIRAKRFQNGTVAYTIGLILLGYGAGHQLVYGLLGISGDPSAQVVHGYLPAAGWLASIAAVGAFGLVARSLFARADSDDVSPPWRMRAALSMSIPALGFVGGELVEVALAPTPYVALSMLLAVGVPVQAAIGLVAFLIARLTICGLRLVMSLVGAWRGELIRACASLLPTSTAPGRAPSAPMVSSRAGRAPPAAFV
ncbi:MAG: hypothetical protein JHD02_10630 [Thermoleophilaceae bacterium]|nr:hypothetical protein [Thermoleophilaceae bacterium]